MFKLWTNLGCVDSFARFRWMAGQPESRPSNVPDVVQPHRVLSRRIRVLARRTGCCPDRQPEPGLTQTCPGRPKRARAWRCRSALAIRVGLRTGQAWTGSTACTRSTAKTRSSSRRWHQAYISPATNSMSEIVLVVTPPVEDW